MDMGVDQSGPCGSPEPDQLGAATRRRACTPADADDPSVRSCGDLWLAAREQNGPLHQRPYVLAMISFMISSEPAPMRPRRALRHALSTGNSCMYPCPPRIWMASSATSTATCVASSLACEISRTGYSPLSHCAAV